MDALRGPKPWLHGDRPSYKALKGGRHGLKGDKQGRNLDHLVPEKVNKVRRLL